MNGLRYNSISVGGLSDVRKAVCDGREVAVKVFRVRTGSSLQETQKVSHHRRASLLVCVGELIIPFVEVLQGGHNLEVSPPSEHTTARGGDRDWESIRDDV